MINYYPVSQHIKSIGSWETINEDGVDEVGNSFHHHNASRSINLFNGILSYYTLQQNGLRDINLAIIATSWRASRLNYVP